MTVNVRPGARSPLNAAKFGTEDTVIIQEIPFTPGYDIRVSPDSKGYDEVNTALGLVLPTHVGQVARSHAQCLGQPDYEPEAKNGVCALALGPDWWFATGTADVESLVAPIRERHHLSIVDVSAQRTKIELYGPQSRAILEHVWEQDLRDENFGIDACSQGIMGKSPVILWHCCTDCYIIFVRSSFAQHLWSVLTDAAIEYL